MLKGVPIILPDLLMIMEDLVKLNLGYNFIDENGNYLIDGTLIDITRFGNGYAGVKIDSTNWVFVDKRMNIISEEYEEVKPFNENYAAIKKDNLWGYIDTTFQVKIPCKYDNCSSFKKGLASFEIKREALMIEGYINKRGEVVWQKEYSNWD
jgi:S-adenosylmethionine hydrolase